jgi:hypothetical protein
MKKLLLALLLVLASAVPVASQPAVFGCNKVFSVNQAAVALTRILTGVSGQHIDICGLSLNAGAAAGSASLSYGTGSNCGTGTVTLIPAIALGVNGIFVDHIAVPHIPVPAVNASGTPIDVCLVTVGAGPTTVILYYAQF